MSLLMTPTLVDNVAWFMQCPSSWKERAYKSLYNTLARIWDGGSKATERGQRFEKTVCDVIVKKAHKKHDFKCSPEFRAFVEECDGGEFQKKLKRILEVDGVEYLIYGKADVAFPDLIKDIKTTQEYKGKESYLKKSQHLMYVYASRIPNFRWLVAEFGDEDSLKIREKHFFDYTAPSVDAVIDPLKDKIRETMTIINGDKELQKLYLEKFNMYS